MTPQNRSASHPRSPPDDVQPLDDEQAALLQPPHFRNKSPRLYDALPQPPPFSTPIATRTSGLHGYFLITISTLAFSIMSVLVRLVETRLSLSPINALFARACVQTILSFGYLTLSTSVTVILGQLSKRQVILLILRGVSGALSLLGYFFAMSVLPTGDVVAIAFLVTVFQMGFTRMFLHEPISRMKMLAAIVGLFGGVLVAWPTMATNSRWIFGVMCATATALLSGLSYMAIRAVGTDVHWMVSTTVLGLCAGITAGLIGGSELITDIGPGVGVMGIAAVLGLIGQACLNKGLQLCAPATGMLLRNVEVVAVYVLAAVALGEVPTVLHVVGASMVVVSSLVIGVERIVRS